MVSLHRAESPALTLGTQASHQHQTTQHQLPTGKRSQRMNGTAPDNQPAEPPSTQLSLPSLGRAMRAGGSGCLCPRSFQQQKQPRSPVPVLPAGTGTVASRLTERRDQRGLRWMERHRKQRCCEKLRGLHAARVNRPTVSKHSAALGRTNAHRIKNPAEAAGLRQTCWLVSDLGAAPPGCRSTSDGATDGILLQDSKSRIQWLRCTR